jgi:cytochrome c oxidase assembly protein subunit 15
MGIHVMIEFGNRLLTFALALIAVAGFVLALRQQPRRRRVVRLSVLAGLGIPAQAVIGGVTVLTDLNPWVVRLPLRRVDGGDRGGVRVLARHD